MMKKYNNNKIEIKKNAVRGDEVAVLFFSLVFFAFLVVSFFRLFAIGKFFDDFIFLFLFGWSKYLVYLFLIIFTVPIFFNFYFKMKYSFFLGIFLTFFTISWLIQNIAIISTTNKNIWKELSFYNFENLSSYFQLWWKNTIINNYHGFFSQPISFENWQDVNSFFPTFATGGIISNFLVFLSGFGGFITSLIVNLFLLIICFSWLFLPTPWFLFTSVFLFFKAANKDLKKKKSDLSKNKVKKTKIKNKQVKVKETVTEEKLYISQEKKEDNEIIVEKKITNNFNEEDKNYFQEPLKPERKETEEILIKNVLQESGMLTPFGKIDEKPKTITVDLENETKDIK